LNGIEKIAIKYFIYVFEHVYASLSINIKKPAMDYITGFWEVLWFIDSFDPI